jgi:hypothetical protein
MLTYSFIKHPFEKLVGSLNSILPGVSEGYALYSKSDKELNLIKYDKGEVATLKIKSNLHLVQKFRKEKITFNWLSEEMLPFLEDYKSGVKVLKQLSIEDEEVSNYLCIKLLSPYDNLYDVFIIKIENSGVFEISKSNVGLSAQQRNIIGKLLYQTIKFRVKEEYQNLETHTMVLNNILLQQKSMSEMSDELELLRMNYKKSILYFIQNVLKRMSDQFKVNVTLSEKAQDYVLSKDLELDIIEKIIVQAAHMALNMSLSYSSTIIIQPENIMVNQTDDLEIKSSQNTKHNGIIDMLDKYEEAAQKAQEKEWKINGNTVAQLCNPPITPAAITFNLKKYQKQINILLDRYDEKWSLIRSEFKPLKNIVVTKTSELSKIKTA